LNLQHYTALFYTSTPLFFIPGHEVTNKLAYIIFKAKKVHSPLFQPIIGFLIYAEGSLAKPNKKSQQNLNGSAGLD